VVIAALAHVGREALVDPAAASHAPPPAGPLNLYTPVNRPQVDIIAAANAWAVAADLAPPGWLVVNMEEVGVPPSSPSPPADGTHHRSFGKIQSGHGYGRTLEQAGQPLGAVENGLVVDIDPDRFEEMVVAALDGLPEELGRLMRNVAVTVEHAPGPPGLLGLYQGVPLTSRTSQYAGVLPDRITIYRQAVCAICRTEQEVADQVRRTVIHEIAHHFGIDDHRLTELGW
jgi:predicted Zn-dependent protease with MMP-like domain